jgi:hypothetical protein
MIGYFFYDFFGMHGINVNDPFATFYQAILCRLGGYDMIYDIEILKFATFHL